MVKNNADTSTNTDTEMQKSFIVKHSNLITLIIGSLIIFTVGLWRNDFAYTYYSAAAQAGSQSWKAFFFASFDSANFINIDKPPVAIWFSSLSVRAFGLSPFTVLLPHAIAGMLTVVVLYKTTTRYFDQRSAFIGALIFLFTPVSAVVFRYNLTDSFLTLFIVLSIYLFLRALESNEIRWLILCGLTIGFGFNTKMAQALIVVPILGIMYLYNSPKKVLKNLFDVVIFGLVTIISSFWWVLVVALTDKENRPYIGGTETDSISELVFQHNGFGRFFGNNWDQSTGASSGVAFGGETGIFRMFNTGFGPNYIWFFFIAVVSVFLVLKFLGNRDNYWMIKNYIGVWFSFILLNMAVYSFTEGTIHPYYPVIFAPAIAALASAGLSILWAKDIGVKEKLVTQKVVFLTIFFTVIIFVPLYLLDIDTWSTVLAITVLVVLSAMSLLALISLTVNNISRFTFSFKVVLALLSIVPVVMTLATVINVQYGFVPTSQPIPDTIKIFQRPDTSIPDDFRDFLVDSHQSKKWIAVVDNAMVGAPIQLSTQKPVMALGGFSGNDNPLTLKEFQVLVKDNQVQYFVFDNKQSQAFRPCPDLPFRPSDTDDSSQRENLRSNPIFSNCSTGISESEKSTAAIEEWALTRNMVKEFGGGQWRIYDLSVDGN